MSEPNFPYYNTVDQIFHAEWSIPKLARLELLRRSIRTLWPEGHPTKFVHVAGTSGKGSTSRFLELGFSCVGKSGAFLSPHLFDYRERISINGEFAERDDITQAWETRIKPHCIDLALNNGDHVHSFLEASILIALTLFEHHGVEWAAIEAGVGGRYDQTRSLDAVASVLTNVGSDHAHMLGKKQWQRALDKSGIARQGAPFFTSDEDAETLALIEAVTQSVDAPLTVVSRADAAQFAQQVVDGTGEAIPVNSLLSASYQQLNARLAFATLTHFYPEIDEAQVFEKFVAARLVGRFSQVDEHVYADVAHNAEKVRALTGEINVRFGKVGKLLVLGASSNKMPLDVFPELAKVAKSIIVTGASFKGLDPEVVRGQIDSLTGETPSLVIADPRQALQVARSMRTGDDVIILTGSTYMIEQVLNPDEYLRYSNSIFGWRMEQPTVAKGSIELTIPVEGSPVR